MATQLNPDHRLKSPFAAAHVGCGTSQADYLRAQAQRCRRLAAASSDVQTVSALDQMAEEYEARARLLTDGC